MNTDILIKEAEKFVSLSVSRYDSGHELLLLKSMMNTATGREMANERH